MMNFIKSLSGRIQGRIDFSRPGIELLTIVFERLRKLAPSRPHPMDKTLMTMQESMVADDLIPLAVAVIALKKSSIVEDYLRESVFEQLCERAADMMATLHAASSASFTALLPKLPGLVVTAGHDKDGASNIAGGKIYSALDLIRKGEVLLPEGEAVFNLSNFMGEKLKMNRFEAKKLFDGL